MPRILSMSGGWNLILNAACSEAAANLQFPVIHPIPDLQWNRNKTRSLPALHSVLAREGGLEEWEGSGIAGFPRVLRKLEEKLGGTHPDFVTERVIHGLQEAIDSDIPPFSLSEIDGIVMLDHSPVLPQAKQTYYELFHSIGQFTNWSILETFRQGLHGFLLKINTQLVIQKICLIGCLSMN